MFKHQSSSTDSTEFSGPDGEATRSLRLSDEAPVLEQFKAVLAGGDRGTSDPARRADLVARKNLTLGGTFRRPRCCFKR